MIYIQYAMSLTNMEHKNNDQSMQDNICIVQAEN
jgi:hypothetical protein